MCVCAWVLVCVFACVVRFCVRQGELRKGRDEIAELKKALEQASSKGHSVNQSLTVCLSPCLLARPSFSGFARYLSRILGLHSSEPAILYTRERTHPHRHASVHTECTYSHSQHIHAYSICAHGHRYARTHSDPRLYPCPHTHTRTHAWTTANLHRRTRKTRESRHWRWHSSSKSAWRTSLRLKSGSPQTMRFCVLCICVCVTEGLR